MQRWPLLTSTILRHARNVHERVARWFPRLQRAASTGCVDTAMREPVAAWLHGARC